MAVDNKDKAEGAPPKADAPKTQTYTVKAGAEISRIEDGDVKLYTGGKDIELTDDQARAFNDKLEGLSDPEVANTRSQQTILVGAETAGRATINEGSAAADVGAEPGDDNPENTSNTDEVDRPGELQVAPVKSASDLAPKENASSSGGGTDKPAGGDEAGASSSTAGAGNPGGPKGGKTGGSADSGNKS